MLRELSSTHWGGKKHSKSSSSSSVPVVEPVLDIDTVAMTIYPAVPQPVALVTDAALKGRGDELSNPFFSPSTSTSSSSTTSSQSTSTSSTGTIIGVDTSISLPSFTTGTINPSTSSSSTTTPTVSTTSTTPTRKYHYFVPDAFEANSEILRAENMFYLNPIVASYSTPVYEALKLIHDQCATDYAAYCENGPIRVLSSDQTGLRSLRGTSSAIIPPSVYEWVRGSLFRDTPKMRRLSGGDDDDNPPSAKPEPETDDTSEVATVSTKNKGKGSKSNTSKGGTTTKSSSLSTSTILSSSSSSSSVSSSSIRKPSAISPYPNTDTIYSATSPYTTGTSIGSNTHQSTHQHTLTLHPLPTPFESDEYFVGAIGYGAEGDICLYSHIKQISVPCQNAIHSYHDMRIAYWTESTASSSYSILFYILLGMCLSVFMMSWWKTGSVIGWWFCWLIGCTPIGPGGGMSSGNGNTSLLGSSGGNSGNNGTGNTAVSAAVVYCQDIPFIHQMLVSCNVISKADPSVSRYHRYN